ncbi:MAG: type IV secretion system protein VirB8 [Candidatus Xenolissoclinum pacificiensis L6]|uniref:Type IV secretion system protein VirB8 n=1 Tax=Candidatus Xenolissoclinum pacificiensis L6 TaxID=1401685 RepID=W2V2Q4_9RICK|nr:MAG: type IV secretion system protein VirB8 [Candidatus Xenolissoclinum pacificiensis L6]
MLSFLKGIKKKNETVYNWYDERVNFLLLQRKALTFFVVLTLSLMCLLTIVILSLSQDKTVEPFVIEISDNTGIPTVVDSVSLQKYSADRKLSEYFIYTYIKAREASNFHDYARNFYVVVKNLSTGPVFTEFTSQVLRRSNPDSPLNVLPNVSNVSLRIRSIQYLDLNNVQVRFTVEMEQSAGLIVKNKIVNIGYLYVDQEMTNEERYINPLGFRITSYKVNDEFI